MKKINEILKNNKAITLIAFVLIIIILVSSLSVYATYNYFAKDIGYTKKDGTTINVEDALNYLYQKNNKDKYYNDLIVYDQSGNNYDAILLNGTCVKTDSDGTKSLYFDGVDDYVELTNLSSNINWNDGFSVEIELKFNNVNDEFSRIICGPTAFSLITSGSELYFTQPTGNIRTISNINANEKYNFKFTFIKNKEQNFYDVNFYKNDSLYYSTTASNGINNSEYKMYLSGNKGWSGDKCINGNIYFLKIMQADETPIVEYKFQ